MSIQRIGQLLPLLPLVFGCADADTASDGQPSQGQLGGAPSGMVPGSPGVGEMAAAATPAPGATAGPPTAGMTPPAVEAPGAGSPGAAQSGLPGAQANVDMDGVAAMPTSTGSGAPPMASMMPAATTAGTSTAAPPVAPASPPVGEGFEIGGICIPACDSADADADGDGCGFEAEQDCVMPDAELVSGATACVADGSAPPAGSGHLMGCECVRLCDSPDSDPDEEGVTDGWGWEYGATCVVAGSATVEGKLSCEPTAMVEGDGYLVTGEDGVERCVAACERPEWVEDAAGWGFEYQQTCIVSGSEAEAQVARCELGAREELFEPGEGFMLMDNESGENVCFARCSDSADDGDVADDGFGFELERTCIFADSPASIKGLPCIPPEADVSGTCPSPLSCPQVNGSTLSCGCTWVEGLADRKGEIVAQLEAEGLQSFGYYFMASAMMETSGLQADYPEGDVYPDGRPKTGDAYNAGLCKQNWGMIRRCSELMSNDPNAYQTAAAMNTDLGLDIRVYNACRQSYGEDWWAAHRQGDNNRSTRNQDIAVFKAAMDWTYEMLEAGDGHYQDDVYFWVDVGAI